MTSAAPAAPVSNPPAWHRFGPDDLFTLPDQGKGFEFVHGRLKESNVSTLTSFVATEVYFALRTFAGAHNPGWVFAEGISYRCFPEPGRVRRADTSFHRLDRLTAEQASTHGHCPVAPDLAVEVVSPNDLADDVEEKRGDWQDAGVPLIWVVYPGRRTVHAFQARGPSIVFGPADRLTADPVLPGFGVPVADRFPAPPAAAT